VFEYPNNSIRDDQKDIQEKHMASTSGSACVPWWLPGSGSTGSQRRAADCNQVARQEEVHVVSRGHWFGRAGD
jgi:hypothetical protein